ncbi:hypothetical protein SAMN04488570_2815 [Nocardioides scoriae]|uniref:Uncharacterized protein n=2 Tax=Nocardioides scoriae TaxID=642780 RepID=A0A1H1VF98_9ACTN|nr:hypothetical protein SAMN04488570_2815 [Nocardioides scoriae]
MQRVVTALPDTLVVDLCGSIVTGKLGRDDIGRVCYVVSDPIVQDYDGQPVRIPTTTLDYIARVEQVTLGDQDADSDFRAAVEEEFTEDYRDAEPHITRAIATWHQLKRADSAFEFYERYDGPDKLGYSQVVRLPQRFLVLLAMLVSPEFAALKDAQYEAAEALAPEWTHTPSELAASVRGAVG